VITQDIEIALQLEERLIHVWPAVSVQMMEGWVVRLAHGYSGRANSASALVRGAKLSDAARADMERLYTNAGLTPQVRLTPIADSSMQAVLMANGYRLKDKAQSMVAALSSRRCILSDVRVALSGSASTEWLAGVCRSQPTPKRSTAHLLDIVGRIRVPAAFATLQQDGRPVAFGLGALDRGFAEIGCVAVDEALRDQGLGGAIMTRLMAWAAALGAHSAFLQVDVTNSNAIALYEKLGFATAYTYKTMIRNAAA
jgi:N-acetylglutamate synthase